VRVKNIRFHPGLDLDEYLKLPGKSFSSIKNDGVTNFAPTEKMRLGTMVHQYLNESHLYDHTNERHELIEKLAITAKSAIGGLLPYCEGEASVTADFLHEGFLLPYKGRIDACIKGKVIIDYKIINSRSIYDTLHRFGYNEQLTGYMMPVKALHAFIIAVSTITMKPEVVLVQPNYAYWENIIITKGIPLL